jgi:hypothetical protein
VLARRRGHLRVAPDPSLVVLWERIAGERLDAAVASALGGVPEDLTVQPTVVRAPVAYALNTFADQPTDLLVLGAGPRHPLAQLLCDRIRRRAVACAHSPAMLVAAPALPRALRRELRRITPDDFFRPARHGLSR